MEKEGYSLVPSREKLFAMPRSLFEDRANDMQERMREIVGDSGDECIPVKITKKIAFFLLEFRDLPVDDRKTVEEIVKTPILPEIYYQAILTLSEFSDQLIEAIGWTEGEL